VVEDGIDGRGLNQGGLATKNKIISKKERTNGWIAGPQADTRKIPVLQFGLQPDG
jgi:hypothetical protein